MTNATPSNSILSMRILKITSCQTCSAKATLTYHLGCTSNSEIHFRVTNNTGGGFFSPEWIAMSAIQQALDNAPQPITSFALTKLFQGKSVNTPGFLMAVLKHEGLMQLLEGKQRGYVQIDSTAFMAEVNKLITSAVDLQPAESVTPIKKSATTLPPKKSKQS